MYVQVYLASASPPVRYPNVYGVDMPTRKEFVAYDLTEDDICKVLAADGLLYQSVDDLFSVGWELNPNIKQFEASCFTGEFFPCALVMTVGNTVLSSTANLFDTAVTSVETPQLIYRYINLPCLLASEFRPMCADGTSVEPLGMNYRYAVWCGTYALAQFKAVPVMEGKETE